MNAASLAAVQDVSDFHALDAQISGDVVTPDDSQWDAARQAWNLAVDQRPAAVALVESAEDVVAVVRFAVANGLRVAPQGTGHNAAPMAAELADSILVKTERMRGIEVDAVGMVARVDAGVLWAEVTEEVTKHGLAALAGSSPDVGVVGYTLGGGVSFLSRRYGLASNSVVAIEIVTADGILRRVDRATDPDLFWALRGGSGNFGVVTALEFLLYPIRELNAGLFFFGMERGLEVLEAWRQWTADLPDHVTSVGRFIQFPPFEEIPEPMRGRSFVIVEVMSLLPDAESEELVAPLRALEPEMDTFARIPAAGLGHIHMDPPQPVPGKGDGMLLDDLTPEAIEAFVAAAGSESGSPLVSAEIRHLGGALARRSRHHGALASVDASFALFAVGMAMSPEMAEAVERHVDVVKDAMAPWDTGRKYLNFAERQSSARTMFPEMTYQRLRHVKAQYDPAGVFQANHAIPAARS